MTALVEKLTIDDYLTLPNGPPRYQLIDGKLVVSPSPSLPHQRALQNLFRALDAHVLRLGLGQVFIAPLDLFLPDHNVFQPDLLFVSNGRAHLIQDDGIHGAPDIIAEVLSPSTALIDKTVKRKIYASKGVLEYWLIDPSLRQVQLYNFAKNQTKAVQVLGDKDVLHSAVVPGFALDVGRLF